MTHKTGTRQIPVPSATKPMNLNKVFFLGNLTRDPELRQTPSGQAVCLTSLATNQVFTDKAGVKQKQAEFHNIVLWGKQAEIVNQYLRKGSLLLVEGRLQTRDWEKDGQKHYRTEIVAEQIQLGPKPSGQPREEAGEVIDVAEEDEEIDVKDIAL
jgi:single-strand DNA-binding protein